LTVLFFLFRSLASLSFSLLITLFLHDAACCLVCLRFARFSRFAHAYFRKKKMTMPHKKKAEAKGSLDQKKKKKKKEKKKS